MNEFSNRTNVRRKFALIFLDTGNGHRSQANVLKEVLSNYIPAEDIILLHGFGKKHRLLSLVFEKGYTFALTILKGAYPLLYDIAQHKFFLRLAAGFLDFLLYPYAKKMISSLGITDLVSLHFATTPVFAKAARNVSWPVKVTAIVTDPFSCHNSWFYDKSVDTIVYSEEIKKVAIKNGMSEKKIFLMPFLVNKKFRNQDFSLTSAQMKEKLCFDSKLPLLLIAGGGGGLPGATKIVKECVRQNLNAEICVICGRNKEQEIFLQVLSSLHPQKRIHVFPFVTRMDEFFHAADVLVTKPGASMTFEALCTKCPLILSHYIHNQELGNMQFVVKNRLGYFIQKPKDICARIKEVFEDPDAMSRIHFRCKSLVLDTQVEKIADFLLSK